MKWCASGAAFLQLPFFRHMRTELLLLTDYRPTIETECAVNGSRIDAIHGVLDREIRAFAAAANRTGAHALGTHAAFSIYNLYKWQVLQYVHYDLILYTDPDVDLFFESGGLPPRFGSALYGALKQTWTHDLLTFWASSAELAAGPDGASAINGGLLLLKPSLATFQLGRRILRTRRFDVQHGFNGSGRPRDVLPHERMPQWFARELNRTHMVKKDTWDFTNGDADQGLFSYVYLVAQRMAAFMPSPPLGRHMAGWNSSHHVAHFWGPSKPWKTWGVCPRWYAFLGPRRSENQPNGKPLRPRSPFVHPPTFCTTLLTSMRQHMEEIGSARVRPCRHNWQRVV